MAEAAVKTLAFHLERMLEREEGTRLGEDSEELHVMRVSTRRMRMALRVFDEYLDPETMRPVLKGLRRTGRVLGAVRDLDVFQEKTQDYLDGLPAERAGDVDGLLAACRAERDKQREHLVEYLDGDRYRRFVEQFRELLARPLARRSRPADRRPAASACGPGAAGRAVPRHGRGVGVRGPCRRSRHPAARVPRPAQGLQGPPLHPRVLRGRAWALAPGRSSRR